MRGGTGAALRVGGGVPSGVPRSSATEAKTGSSTGAGVPARISSDRHAANWSTSLPLTSASTPRPNCAGLPVTFRSVSTSTSVLSPLSMRRQVISALAVPVPRVSLPLPSMTATCVASSLDTKDALPP